MSVPDAAEKLIRLLEADGWRRSESEIVAPHGTMWLDATSPWGGAGMDSEAELLDRMRGRLARIVANRSKESAEGREGAWQHSCNDTRSLIACLEKAVKTTEGGPRNQSADSKAMYLLERNFLVTIKPGVGPRPHLSAFHWRMHFSLPYPFPAKECVKQSVTIMDKEYSFSIHNHFNRVIKMLRQGDSGPTYFSAVLEDKRRPLESYTGCVSFAREALQSVVIFEELTDYPSGEAAFEAAETKIGKCCEWLASFLSACQRAAPYLTSWLVYPVSLFDAGTVYHDVTAFCSNHGQRHVVASGVAISMGRQLQNPAFVMDVPESVEGSAPLDAANELLAESLMSLFRGMPRLAVLNAYTAVESLANVVFTATKVGMLVGHNVPKEVAEKLVEEERERHRTEPQFLFNKGIKDASGRSLLDEDKERYDALLQLQKMRHRVAHTGYKPTLDEAREAHKVCCEAVRWFAGVGGMPVKPMLPDADSAFPGISTAVKDAHTKNPLELDFIRHLLNASVSPNSIPPTEQEALSDDATEPQ
jgi:hypothetical protein